MTREQLTQIIRDNVLGYDDCDHIACAERTGLMHPEYTYNEFGCGYTYESRVQGISDILEAIDTYTKAQMEAPF